MDDLYLNTNSRGDFLRPALESCEPDSAVYAAVAFFTHAGLLKHWSQRGCNVKIIVRLCRATSPAAIGEVIDDPRIQIRYFTSQHFHPKLYILGGIGAYVGSSNLTDAGLVSNQEVNVLLDMDDPRYEELLAAFEEYWSAAAVLSRGILDKFAAIRDEASSADRRYEDAVSRDCGNVSFPNITRPGSGRRDSKISLYQADFLRQYQAFLKGFAQLQNAYRAHGRRKLPATSRLPLRIEVDRFLTWIADNKLPAQQGNKPSVPGANHPTGQLGALIDEFMAAPVDTYLEELDRTMYPEMSEWLKSPASIAALTEDKLYGALTYVYAFFFQYRFYPGGIANMQAQFFRLNEAGRVRRTITYLLHGSGPFEERIARCIYDSDYSLTKFGENCITELYGWMNTEDVPLLNSRTRRCLRWLGYVA
jgi:hypothetical protein